MNGVSFGLDMTSLLIDDSLDPVVFIQEIVQHFAQDIHDRLRKLCAYGKRHKIPHEYSRGFRRLGGCRLSRNHRGAVQSRA